MKEKYFNNDYGGDGSQSEHSYSPVKLSKQDFELYDDEKAVPNQLIRVKRMGSIGKNERWRIFEDDDLKFVLEAAKLSKKECAFLRGVEGVNWILEQYRAGFKSFSELRGRLKNKI